MEQSLVRGTYERSNIWKIPTSASKYHPAEFPLQIPLNLVRYYSFVNDVVLDMFSGSGTTVLACVKTNRQYIGIENNINYYNISLKRLNSNSIC